MKNCKQLPYRQIHLDFHTSGDIPGVGENLDPEEFKRTLADAAVDSITLFSLCHHGYSYHPTEVGVMRPTLQFDLLGAQLKTAKEAGSRTQSIGAVHLPRYDCTGMETITKQ